jgi:hypothetical protein
VILGIAGRGRLDNILFLVSRICFSFVSMGNNIPECTSQQVKYIL